MSKKTTEFRVPQLEAPKKPKIPAPQRSAQALAKFYDGAPTGNAEQDSKKELSALGLAFAADRKNEQSVFEHNTATNFYSVMIFQTREQLDAFHAALGVKTDIDLFVDGCELAAKMGISLPPAPKFSKPKRMSAKIASIPKIS